MYDIRIIPFGIYCKFAVNSEWDNHYKIDSSFLKESDIHLIYLIFSVYLANKCYKIDFPLSKGLCYSEFIVNLQ